MKTSKTKETLSEEDNKIKEESSDAQEELKYVCMGGKVKCQYCSSPEAKILVTSNTIKLQDKFYATIGDCDGKVNFLFTGVCNHPSQQKPMSPPPPCKMVISLGKWKNFSDTKICKNNALLVKSTILCMISGKDLTVTDSGQKATPGSIDEVEQEEPIGKITDAYWYNEEGEKIRTVHQDRKVTLYIETVGYKEGDTISLKIKADEGRQYANGETELTVTSQVESDGIATIEDFSITYK